LPILIKLNQQFPGNSTLLNNIGQAWFGLGDVEEAEKYLKEAIRLFAYTHRPTTRGPSLRESRGNTSGAIEALKKSIRKAYTTQKENRLRKLEANSSSKTSTGMFERSRIRWAFHKFMAAPWPDSVEAFDALMPEWGRFHRNARDLLDRLRVNEKDLISQMAEVHKKREVLRRENEQFVKS